MSEKNRSKYVPKILLVEDDDEMRRYLRFELEEEYSVLEAENGKEGLDLAVENLPDLMVVDVMMPVMDGIELCRQIKTNEETAHIGVIMLTARSEEEEQLEGLESGADDYIAKPFSVQVLKARIRNRLKHRLRMLERFRRELDMLPREISASSLSEQFLEKAFAVVEGHMDDFEFDVETFAAELNVVDRTLRRKLKALLGQTPQEFIRTLRLKRAAERLLKSDDTISEVAAQVGILDANHFSRIFKAQFGASPTQYRAGEQT